MLLNSKNNSLNDLIYNHLVTVFRDDIEKNEKNEPISTLAKWLPREITSINKKLHFIDNFTKILFPDIKNKFSACKEYRLITTKLNKRIGTIQAKIARNKYEEIDFDKVSSMALKKYYSKIIKKGDEGNICKENLRNSLIKRYSQYSSYRIVKNIFLKDKNLDEFQLQIYLEIWEKNKKKYYDELLDIIGYSIKYIILVDLSNSIFQNNEIITIISTLLIMTEFNKNCKVYVNCKKPFELNLNNQVTIFDKISLITKNITPCKEIYVDKLNIFDNEKKNLLLIMSNKEIPNFTNSDILYWKLTKTKKIVFVEKQHQLILGNPAYNMYDMEKPKQFIKNILDESNEIDLDNYVNNETRFNNIITCSYLICILLFIICNFPQNKLNHCSYSLYTFITITIFYLLMISSNYYWHKFLIFIYIGMITGITYYS